MSSLDNTDPPPKRRKTPVSLPDPSVEQKLEKRRQNVKALEDSIQNLQSTMEWRFYRFNVKHIQDAHTKEYHLIEAMNAETATPGSKGEKALMTRVEDAVRETSDLIDLAVRNSKRLEKLMERVKRDLKLVIEAADE
ncbi:hypothetical protein N7466_003156 [Penicillium verhagenii]|uniref:uncharacterized protein n=1 Tax=Penicillium verhagenii TaxID=1562060 RepID=UPI00254539BD|nr:uncharacterized protein N7466_003156 [Penicillium verhagenii]KAJ5936706.1 hypothetical protein N7466_003156 [Penicillium verhagenii]